MDEKQIRYVASRDRILKNAFRGVFAANELPTLRRGECAIVNILNRGEGVGHWCAIFKRPDGRIELFDSLCLPESRKKFKHDIRNRLAVQSLNSKKCGLFSLFFLRARIRAVPFGGLIRLLLKKGAPQKDSFLSNSLATNNVPIH